jgi:hypothetical protein
MLIAQANPGFELDPTDKKRSGYNDFIAALETESSKFKGQVVTDSYLNRVRSLRFFRL